MRKYDFTENYVFEERDIIHVFICAEKNIETIKDSCCLIYFSGDRAVVKVQYF